MSVFFTNKNTGYVVSGDDFHGNSFNILLKTTNGGFNWFQTFSFNNGHLTDIYF